jgi:hypothetical protein
MCSNAPASLSKVVSSNSYMAWSDFIKKYTLVISKKKSTPLSKTNAYSSQQVSFESNNRMTESDCVRHTSATKEKKVMFLSSCICSSNLP